MPVRINVAAETTAVIALAPVRTESPAERRGSLCRGPRDGARASLLRACPGCVIGHRSIPGRCAFDQPARTVVGDVLIDV